MNKKAIRIIKRAIKKINERDYMSAMVLLSGVIEILEESEEKLKQNIGGLRQWLNEDRVKEDRYVSNTELYIMLNLIKIDRLEKQKREEGQTHEMGEDLEKYKEGYNQAIQEQIDYYQEQIKEINQQTL